MSGNIKKTVPNSSIGVDMEQSSIKNNNIIIPKKNKNINSLETISMTELLDNTYPPRMPIINEFLYSGTYLFVGAPKVGKSFFGYLAIMSVLVLNYGILRYIKVMFCILH